jgi:hypothetical protein
MGHPAKNDRIFCSNSRLLDSRLKFLKVPFLCLHIHLKTFINIPLQKKRKIVGKKILFTIFSFIFLSHPRLFKHYIHLFLHYQFEALLKCHFKVNWRFFFSALNTIQLFSFCLLSCLVYSLHSCLKNFPASVLARFDVKTQFLH